MSLNISYEFKTGIGMDPDQEFSDTCMADIVLDTKLVVITMQTGSGTN